MSVKLLPRKATLFHVAMSECVAMKCSAPETDSLTRRFLFSFVNSHSISFLLETKMTCVYPTWPSSRILSAI